MTHLKCLGLLSIALIIPAPAAVITFQETSSFVESGGVEQLRNDQSATDGFASSQAIWPPGNNIPQARTAARSGVAEIAANARVYSNVFNPLQPIDLALSQALYTIEIPPAFQPSSGHLQFFLPPSYVELVNNAETPFNAMHAIFFADLRVCQKASCSVSDRQFYLQANIDGDFRNTSHAVQATGNPALDLSSLLNPTVSDTSAGLLRTYLVEFRSFFGDFDIGSIDPASVLRVEYLLQARASGIASFNSAIAAVNDPFDLSTDPVQQGSPLALTLSTGAADVPEPSTISLTLVAVLCALLRFRAAR